MRSSSSQAAEFASRLARAHELDAQGAPSAKAAAAAFQRALDTDGLSNQRIRAEVLAHQSLAIADAPQGDVGGVSALEAAQRAVDANEQHLGLNGGRGYCGGYAARAVARAQLGDAREADAVTADVLKSSVLLEASARAEGLLVDADTDADERGEQVDAASETLQADLRLMARLPPPARESLLRAMAERGALLSPSALEAAGMRAELLAAAAEEEEGGKDEVGEAPKWADRHKQQQGQGQQQQGFLRRNLGGVGAATAFVLAKGKWALGALKLTKLGPVLSMCASIGAYRCCSAPAPLCLCAVTRPAPVCTPCVSLCPMCCLLCTANLPAAAVTDVMCASIGAYSIFFGWPFAAGFVGLIFVHECGHAVVMRHYGVPFSPMLFIPFMGAFALCPGGACCEC